MAPTRYKALCELGDHDHALLRADRDVASHAYNPVSHFHLGAAPRSLDGCIYVGTFLESSALPLGRCAAPTALHAALPNRVRRFAATTVGGGREAQAVDLPVTRCGGCRQRSYDVTGGSAADLRLICADLALHRVPEVRITALLPLAFDPAMLKTAAWQPPPIRVNRHRAGGDEVPPVAGRLKGNGREGR